MMLNKPKGHTILPIALLGLAVLSTPFVASAQQPYAQQQQEQHHGNDSSNDRRDNRARDNGTDPRGQNNAQRDGRYRIVSTVNLRSGAGINFRRIGQIRAGRVVEVDQVRNGWLHVRGQGWMSGQFARRA